MTPGRGPFCLAAAAACALTAIAPAVAADPGPKGDGDKAPLVTPQRLAKLPRAEREAWTRYLEGSRRMAALDRDAMERELRAAGKTRMTPAVYRKAFRIEPAMTPAWFASDEAQQMAANMLSFQTPSGGWSKRTEITLRPRQPGESYFSESDGWSYIATLDNESTIAELRFLAGAHAARPDPRYVEAFGRGLAYLFDAQFPNGCWPQVFPLQGGYHDAATHNDDAIVNATRLLAEVGEGRHPIAADPEARRRAAAAAAGGVGCLVATQVVVGGVRTIWAQQHDPLTFAPLPARSYEHAGLCGRESASIATFLMTRSDPDPHSIEAVHAAAVWFKQHQIMGYEYDVKTGLKEVAGAGPIWARIAELPTFRPIFSNRDGKKLYDWNELTDRRTGYTWYSKEPAAVLAAYAAWAPSHPLPPLQTTTTTTRRQAAAR